MDAHGRRRFFKTVFGVGMAGLTGCLRATSPQSTTTTSTEPTDATFEFDTAGTVLRIELTNGGPVPASALSIRSSDGTAVPWAQLGSTSVGESGTVTAGDTAVIGSSVLEWPTSLEASETIRVAYLTDDDVLTTLGRFELSDDRVSAQEDPSSGSGDRNAFSFEQASVSSGSLPSPWYLVGDGGRISVTETASDGSKAIRMISDGDLDPIAVGVDVDLTPVSQIVADMYPKAVGPGFGYVKFLLDEPDRSNGHLHTRDHPGRTAHGGAHTEAFRDGEWHTDIEFYTNTRDDTLVSNISGIHTLILHTSGSNDVIWDNIRFEDDEGKVLPLREVLVGQ